MAPLIAQVGKKKNFFIDIDKEAGSFSAFQVHLEEPVQGTSVHWRGATLQRAD
jgi:hypothetical protein